jgi:hypothetical protein
VIPILSKTSYPRLRVPIPSLPDTQRQSSKQGHTRSRRWTSAQHRNQHHDSVATKPFSSRPSPSTSLLAHLPIASFPRIQSSSILLTVPNVTMLETDLHYPPEACPFCGIAAAFPFPVSPSSSSASASTSTGLWESPKKRGDESERGELQGGLERCIPSEEESQHEKTSPSSFVVLRSRDVVAFLDILPMTGGEYFFSVFFYFLFG